jgi:hypothetical protein
MLVVTILHQGVLTKPHVDCDPARHNNCSWDKPKMPKLTLKYQSGEEIKKGDQVLFHGVLGEIDLVASDPNDPETSWYIEEFGGGVGIKEPISGRTFISADQIPECEDLEFVSQAND